MATKRRFDIGDEVTLHGIVRLLDAAGPGTVTVEISATGQRMTVQELATGLDLVAKGKADAFTKGPKRPAAKAHSRSRIATVEALKTVAEQRDLITRAALCGSAPHRNRTTRPPQPTDN